eukprot:jgi/Psemu1/64550/estExt_Genemark1.C_700021
MSNDESRYVLSNHQRRIGGLATAMSTSSTRNASRISASGDIETINDYQSKKGTSRTHKGILVHPKCKESHVRTHDKEGRHDETENKRGVESNRDGENMSFDENIDNCVPVGEVFDKWGFGVHFPIVWSKILSVSPYDSDERRTSKVYNEIISPSSTDLEVGAVKNEQRRIPRCVRFTDMNHKSKKKSRSSETEPTEITAKENRIGNRTINNFISKKKCKVKQSANSETFVDADAMHDPEGVTLPFHIGVVVSFSFTILGLLSVLVYFVVCS